MKRIIIFTLTLLSFGCLQAVTQAEFNDKFRPLLQENPQILTSSQGKDITVLLGATRSGKSTTLNFLNNIPMDFQGGKFINPTNLQPHQYCKIGSTGNSETLSPKHFNVNGHMIYDLAGWNNNTGTIDSLIGAAFIKNIIEKASTVKIVFVIDENAVSVEGGERVLSFFTKAQAVFDSIAPNLEQHSIVVLTKTTEQANRWDYLKNEMCAACFPGDAKKLFGLWTEAQVFPFSKGELKDDERQNILDAINALEAKPIQPQNKLNIEQIYNGDVQSEINDLFNHIHQEAINIVATEYDNLPKNNLDQLNNAQAFLNNIQNAVIEKANRFNMLSDLFKDVTENMAIQQQQQALPGKVAIVKNQKGNQLTQLINAENARLAQIAQAEQRRKDAVSNTKNLLSTASKTLEAKSSGNYETAQVSALKNTLSGLQNRLASADTNKSDVSVLNQINNETATLQQKISDLKPREKPAPAKPYSPSNWVKVREKTIGTGFGLWK